MAYITPADIKKRVPAEVWVQLFDVDRDGAVDETPGTDDGNAIAQAITASQSVVDTELHVAFGALDAGDAVVDERVKGAQVLIALYERVRYGPLASSEGASPFRSGYNDALALLKELRTAIAAHLVTGAGGKTSAKRAATGVSNKTDELGNSTTPYIDVANNKTTSGF